MLKRHLLSAFSFEFALNYHTFFSSNTFKPCIYDQTKLWNKNWFVNNWI